jgi:hypothetical protein
MTCSFLRPDTCRLAIRSLHFVCERTVEPSPGLAGAPDGSAKETDLREKHQSRRAGQSVGSSNSFK